jgi:hypothetical protein
LVALPPKQVLLMQLTMVVLTALLESQQHN